MIVARARRAPLDVGSVFKRLTVIALAPRSADGRRCVVCRCACGTVKTIHEGCLREGSTHSCGCRSREAGARNRTHNMSKTPIYKVWSSMLQRCYDENRKDYPRYGAEASPSALAGGLLRTSSLTWGIGPMACR